MHFIHRLFLFLYLFSVLLLIPQPVSANAELTQHELTLQECLLPADHPLQQRLKRLFIHQNMFKSRDHFRDAGFHVIDRMHRGLMVASHPTMKKYLFKKFHNEIPQREQLANFIKRVNGVRFLKEFIQLNHLQHVTVPQKWIYPLPKRFSNPITGERSYILIVEKMDIFPGGREHHGESAKRYYNMDLEILRELCIVVYYCRGLDSMLDNMPFTRQNQIAFIDTEKWALLRDVKFLHHAMSYLSKDRQQYALDVFKELQLKDQKN